MKLIKPIESYEMWDDYGCNNNWCPEKPVRQLEQDAEKMMKVLIKTRAYVDEVDSDIWVPIEKVLYDITGKTYEQLKKGE